MDYGLSKKDVERYSRHLLVREFGVEGQAILRNARVLVVGAGGLGCPVVTYLAGAGVGTIGIVDYDRISLDNLHRQVAHDEDAVGNSKVTSLESAVRRLNSSVTVHCHDCALDGEKALEIVTNYDVVADCSDNAATRYMINDVCVILKKPLISGSALRWEGQLTVYNFGPECPCYRCLFPVPPTASLVTNCSEGGVIGPVVGTIGTMQAMEVIKVATKIGESLAGRLFLYDALSARTRTIQLRKRNPNCAVCGENPSVTKPIDYEIFCGSGVHDKNPSLSVLDPSSRVEVTEYQLLRRNRSSVLIDTRPPHEFAIANFPEAKNVPLETLQKMEQEELRKILGVPGIEHVFVVCHRGNDSQLAVNVIQERLGADVTSGIRIRDLIGGYDMWSQLVDKEFPRY